MNRAKYLNDVLTNFEADDIIEKLQSLTIQEYGSEKMMRQHASLERLNMQSVKNALAGGEDFILEGFVQHEKLKSLIAELFVTNYYKWNIYPRIKDKINTISHVKSYILLYHEAVVINLLENFFYYATACQQADDYVVDILEYSCDKIMKLLNRKKELKDDSSLSKMNEDEEMEHKLMDLENSISFSCISIIRYISDHLTTLSFPVRNHMLNIKDVPMLLCELMEKKPWIQSKLEKKNKDDKETQKIIYAFENNQWNKYNENSTAIPKLEGQVWITLFNLFMNQDNTKKYDISEFRKSNLLRLRKYMNETLFDQIPPLQQLFRALEEMSLMEYSSIPNSNPFIVEMIPTLSNLHKKISQNELKFLCDKILNDYFEKADIKKEMEIISEIYSLSNLEYFMEDPKCAFCSREAASRCSRCKSEWYCSKDCQVKRWKEHKTICNNLAELNKDIEKAEKENLQSSTKNGNKVTQIKTFEELD